MRKTTFLIGAAVGYVLGARAGRRRYEQISALAGRVWGSPQVQHAKAEASSSAKGAAKSAGSNLRDAALNSSAAASVKGAADRATSAVKDKLPGSGGASSPSPDPAAPARPAAAAPPAPVVPVTPVSPVSPATPVSPISPVSTAPTSPGTLTDRTPRLDLPD